MKLSRDELKHRVHVAECEADDMRRYWLGQILEQKTAALEEGIKDLLSNPGGKLQVITPGGKIIRGIVLNMQYDHGSVDVGDGNRAPGLKSASLIIGLEP